jgi:hypothetical protein
MALNKLVYDDIPHVPKKGVKPAPGPHPYKASHRQQYWVRRIGDMEERYVR